MKNVSSYDKPGQFSGHIKYALKTLVSRAYPENMHATRARFEPDYFGSSGMPEISIVCDPHDWNFIPSTLVGSMFMLMLNSFGADG